MDLGEETPGAESMEQFVQLHEHIERLRADRRPLPPTLRGDDEASPYQMAALFRSAAPDASTPDPEFVRSLSARLLRGGRRIAAARSSGATASPPTQPSEQPSGGRRHVSRRGLLRSGLGAAAAAAAGLAVGVGIEREPHSASTTPPPNVPLVQDGAGIWVSVAQEDAIPLGGVMRFNTDYIVGFLRHSSSGFSALSGVCTHMGCILQWNGGDRTFDCPCHGGRFAENGQTSAMSAVAYRPLPTLQTKVEKGQVWVYVPPPTSTSTVSPRPTAGGRYSTP